MTDANRFRGLALLRRLALVVALLLLPLSSTAQQQYTVNLKDTDIQEFIKFVAEATDTTIVIDPAVKGKVKVISSRPVSRDELYDLFLSILDVHGYTAVRSGGVVRIIQSKDARSAPVAVTDDQQRKSSDEYVTQVIRLDNISAAKLIPVLRPLVPQQAHMAAYTPSNAIIISDVSANIARIRDIIERMDRSAVQQTDIVPLRYAVADDVVSMLEKLSQSEARAAGGGEPGLLLVADSRTNSVLINGDELERARLRTLIEHLDTPLQQSGNVKVVYLEYANAVDVAEVLTKVLQNMSQLRAAEGGQPSAGGSSTIEADEGTNALIITADTGEMAALEAVIHRLDIRRAQVLVEAIIVEVTATEGQDLGLQWLFAGDGGFYGSSIDASDQRARRIAGAVIPPEGDEVDSIDDLDIGALAGALAQTPGVSLGWGTLGDNFSMTVILNALKTNSNANILSTPSLLTLDNQEAFITVGQEVPFVTGSFTQGSSGDGTNPFQTIERENVGITLTVTPQINEGDTVVLDIEQEVSDILPGGSALTGASDIITSERRIKTKVLARDGRVVVLGGLIKDDVQQTQQKVPVLGDIPFLGRLFRNDGVSVNKTNLLVFIRSTVIRSDEALAGATADKYRYIRDQQALRRERGLLFLEDEELPVLPEWKEQIRQLESIRDAETATGAATAGSVGEAKSP